MFCVSAPRLTCISHMNDVTSHMTWATPPKKKDEEHVLCQRPMSNVYHSNEWFRFSYDMSHTTVRNEEHVLCQRPTSHTTWATPQKRKEEHVLCQRPTSHVYVAYEWCHFSYDMCHTTEKKMRNMFCVCAPCRDWQGGIISHVTRMNESCHRYEWVVSRMWMSYVTHMNESCHTYGWVMTQIWMSHVTNINLSRHTY